MNEILSEKTGICICIIYWLVIWSSNPGAVNLLCIFNKPFIFFAHKKRNLKRLFFLNVSLHFCCMDKTDDSKCFHLYSYECNSFVTDNAYTWFIRKSLLSNVSLKFQYGFKIWRMDVSIYSGRYGNYKICIGPEIGWGGEKEAT